MKVEILNASGIIPTEFKVLVLPDVVAKVTPGGVHIPETKRSQDQHAATTGILVAMSPVAFTYEHWPEGSRVPQLGDHVVFGKYLGSEIEGKDKQSYRLINDKDILAILESE